MGEAKEFHIKSIIKAFRLMEVLVTSRELQLGECSRLLQLPKATTYRILATLESLGYVQKNPNTLGYAASMKLFELGGRVVQNFDLVQIARPAMSRLSVETGETINLGMLDGVDIICIDKVESKHHLKLDQPVGSRATAYQTAMGKAVLAYLSDEERASLLSRHSIRSGTPKSLPSVSDIEEDLRRVRKRGYAVDNEEYISGVRCVGAPIFNHDSKVIAGLSIAGPTLRIADESIDSLSKLVVETAGFISHSLGAPPSRVGEAVQPR